MLFKKCSFLCWLVWLLCGVYRPAVGSLIGYEGFNYTTNQTIYGQGVDANWPAAGQTYTIYQGNSASGIAEAADMTPYLGLVTSGNQAHLFGTTAPGGTETVFRNFGASYSTANNIYWFSVLLRVDAGAGSHYAGVSLFSDSTENLFFGQRSGSTFWGMERSGSGGSSTNTSVSLAGRVVGFLVVQIDGTTGDATHRIARLYVNPTLLGGAAPATPTATLTIADFSFNRFRAAANGEDLDVDEIRLGTTYADVATIATPTISGLANHVQSYGAANLTVSGVVSALGAVYPTNGEIVNVTLNGVTRPASIAGGAGAFSVSFATATLLYSATPYTITCAYPGSASLNPASNVGSTLTVNPAALNISANSASKAYGNLFAGVGAGQTTFIASGLQNGETIGSVTITASGGTAANSPVGSSYQLTPSLATGGTFSAGNYAITYSSGALTVDPAQLTVTPNAVTRTFDGTTLNNATYSANLANYTVTGFQNSETAGTIGLAFTGSMAFNHATGTVVRNAGIYPLGAGTLALAGSATNYSLYFQNNANNSYGITAKSLAVSGITAADRTANGTAAASLNTSGATLVGVVSPDSVALNTSGAAGAFADADAGANKTVSITGLTLSGANAGNYALTQPATTASISPAALDHFIVSASQPAYVAIVFTNYATAKDTYGNTITTDNSSVVTFSSSSVNLTWDGNLDGAFDRAEAVEISATLVNGVASIPAKDNFEESPVTITATSGSVVGISAPFSVQAQGGSYRSHGSGVWSSPNTWELYNGSAWVVPAPTPPGAGSSSPLIIIQAGHAVALDTNVAEDEIQIENGGQLTVNGGQTLTLRNLDNALGLELHGTLVNNGTVNFDATTPASIMVYDTGMFANAGVVSNSTAGNLVFYGGTYQHNFTTTAGAIPVATWLANSQKSTCQITGFTSNASTPDGLDQNFQNLIWNCPDQTAGINLGSGFTNADSFTISQTGSGSITLGANLGVTNLVTVSSNTALFCGPNTISGGGFALADGGTLGVGSSAGITASGAAGNIQTATRNFSPAANYVYNGTSPQAAGTGLPVSVNALTDNNTAGTLTLAQAITIATSLSLAAGAKVSLPGSTTSTAVTFLANGSRRSAGSWGSSSSAAQHPNDSYFAATTGLLNVSSGVSPVFSGLTSSQSIYYGPGMVTLNGTLSAAGPVYPADGESITVTIDGHAQTTAISGGAGGFSLNFNVASLQHSNATPHLITYAYAGSASLNAVTDTSTYLLVEAVPLTITANADSKIYGSSKTYGSGSTAFTASGLKNGETIGSVTITASGGAGATAAAGNYTLTPSAPVGGTFNPDNYDLVFNPGTLTVAQAALTVTANNLSKTYGQNVVFAGTEFALTGLMNADTVTSVTLASTGAASSAAAGIYAITASGATGSGLANYFINYNSGTLTVSAATPVLTLKAGTLTFGQGLTNASLSGSAATNASNNANVPGSFAFSSGSLVPGAGTTNVSVTFTPSDTSIYKTTSNNISVTVNKATPALTAPTASALTYGQAFSASTLSGGAATNPANNVSVAGTFAFSTPAGIPNVGTTNAAVTFTPADPADFNNAATTASVTVNKVVTALGLISSSPTNGYRANVFFTATLPSAATGAVAFKTNGVLLNNSNLVSGIAYSFTITNLPRGTNLITAEYAGDSIYLGSTNTINQVVTNHPPVAVTTNYLRTAGLKLRLFFADLTSLWTDADGDPVTLVELNLVTTNTVNLATNSTQILYPASAGNVNDQFTYTIRDGQGGTNTGIIIVVVNPFVTGQQTPSALTVNNNAITATFRGIPAYVYEVQRSTNLTVGLGWVDIATNTVGTNGLLQVTDEFSDLGGHIPSSAYYRLKWHP